MDGAGGEEDVDEYLTWSDSENMIFRISLQRFSDDGDENRWKKIATVLSKRSPEELAQHHKALLRYEKHLDQLQEQFIREWNAEQQNVSENMASMEQQNVNACADPAMMQQSQDEDLWKIKKVLQDFDLKKRLLVTRDMARKFVVPVLGATHDEIEKGIVVAIWDTDTRTQHSLLLQKRSRSYVFAGDWKRDFVSRRSLKRYDTVGLYWDLSNNRFNFSVLSTD